jgi:peroxiredoxin Q/BCP
VNNEFDYRLLADTDRAVGSRYGVERGPDENNPAYPKRMTFLIDPQGKLVKIYEVSDAGAHPEEVLTELRQLVAAT